MAIDVLWERHASDSFQKIIDYLQEAWGDKSTKDFVEKTYSIIDVLSLYPEMGKLQFPIRNIRGFVIVKQVTLFYKFQDNKIVLLNFFSTIQHPNKNLHQ